MMITYFEES